MWRAFKKKEEELQEGRGQDVDQESAMVNAKSGKKKHAKVRGLEFFFADTVGGKGRAGIGDALSKEVSRCNIYLPPTHPPLLPCC